jgi:hypothetical protein
LQLLLIGPDRNDSLEDSGWGNEERVSELRENERDTGSFPKTQG